MKHSLYLKLKVSSLQVICKFLSFCDKIKQLPEITDLGGFVDNGSNGANIFVQLKPWEQRKGSEHSATAITEKIYEILYTLSLWNIKMKLTSYQLLIMNILSNIMNQK